MMEKKEMDTKPVLSLHEDHAKVHILYWSHYMRSNVKNVLLLQRIVLTQFVNKS